MISAQGIIFDCDGVLFESRRANLAYYNRILEAFDYPPVTPEDRDRVHLCHTASSPVVLAELLAESQVETALEFAAGLDYRDFIPYMLPEPGLQDMLQLLSHRLPLAVATNRGNSIVEILEHFDLNGYFSTVVCSRDVARPKPAPDMLLLAVDKLGLSPHDCLFIGDSELDQRAAEDAGIPFASYGGALDSAYQLESHQQLLAWFDTDADVRNARGTQR